jgi:glucose/arabinose dehydrogenase
MVGCTEKSGVPLDDVIGPQPLIAVPHSPLVPTTDIPLATGWPKGRMPTPGEGLQVNQFASGLDHPRWLLTLSNGDILVAETAPPPRQSGAGGGLIRDFFMNRAMKKVGAMVPSADRVTLLRDSDGDGVAEYRSVLIEGLHSPFGMALAGGNLYIANADSLVSVPFKPGQASVGGRPVVVAKLPGGRNHHWTKSLVTSPDDSKLYVGVGSNSNVAENGIEEEDGRAAIWEFDVATGKGRIFASGLRNPVGLAFEPHGKQLWTVVNERDEIGSDVPPDYLTSVRDGGFYGWPWSYWGGNVDTRVTPARPDMVEKAVVPDYALGPHVAALGLAFNSTQALGQQFGQGAFVGEHGSWNRTPFSGYKVVFVPFSNGRPNGRPIDVLTGFRLGEKAFGRPVGVQIASDGALLVADDVGNTIWRVTRR